MSLQHRDYVGYNTEWCKWILPQLLPILTTTSTTTTTTSPVAICQTSKEIALVVILLGANDAVLPGCRQHVPLDRYQANLREMVSHLRIHYPGTGVLLVTPSAVYIPDWEAHGRERTFLWFCGMGKGLVLKRYFRRPDPGS